MEGRLTGFSLNRDGSQNVTVTVTADFGPMYDELKDAPVSIEIKKAVKHRSMEANRYAWVLIDQIAARQHIKKSEVYRKAILDIGGVSNDSLMKTEAVPLFRQIWESYGLGNQVEIVDTEEETGWSTVRIYHGSSHYSVSQMSALLDSLIQDAEALGIPTITPKEEEKMLGKWAKKKHEKAVDPSGREEVLHHGGDAAAGPAPRISRPAEESGGQVGLLGMAAEGSAPGAARPEQGTGQNAPADLPGAF